MEGIGIWQLVIVLLILLLIFGSKKIKTLGKDLGESIKGFKDSVQGCEEIESKDISDANK